MAIQVKWQLPFKSLNGTTCRVDIYDANFPPGATPLQLTGAADPFYFEDDNDSDLLNSVVRYRTGYINVIDDGLKEQSKLHPTDTFDRYVEVFYGSTKVFNGYIQVLSFNNELVPTPKVISLPVISPLGLFDKRRFSNTKFMPPRKTTLADLLEIVLAGRYNNVYCPMDDGPSAYGYPTPVSFRLSVHSLAVSPWNDKFYHSMPSPINNLMAPITYYELIEYICKAFGWICHDTPDAIIFTAFDWKGQYVRYPVGSIGDMDDREVITLPSYDTLTTSFTAVDDEANVQLLLPETGIEVTYKGEFGVEKMSFDRTTFYSVEAIDGDTRLRMCFCNLFYISNTFEFGLVLPLHFETNSSTIQPGQGIVAWNGYEGVMISCNDYYVAAEHDLFTIRFYRKAVTAMSWKMEYDIMAGGIYLNKLTDADDEFLEKGYIRTYLTANTDDYLEFKFTYRHGGTGDSNPPLPEHSLIFIHNIRFEPLKSSVPYAEYQEAPSKDGDVIPERSNTSNPVVSTSIEMPMSLYRMGNNLIGDTVLTDKITTYPYLFQPRNELTSRFRLVTAPTLPYARLFSYMSKNWRMIAQAFHPWNDEVTLTMQNCNLLDQTQ